MPDDGFVAFVRDAHEGLLCLADLLEEDPQRAERLVHGALVDTRLRWRRALRGDPAAYARARLIRRHARPRSDAEPTWGFVTEPPLAAGGDGVRRALAELPARSRASVVLCLHEGLAEDDAARLLRTDRESLRTDLAHGVARLEQALALESVHPAVGSTPVPTGADLRAELKFLVERVARPPFDVTAAAAAMSREAAARRRRRWLGGSAAAAALVAGVAVVVHLPGDPTPTGPEPADVAIEVPAEPGTVRDLPTRGSLAGDTAFLDGVQALPWENELTTHADLEDTVPGSRRVVFAGDVPGGRWALVVGTPVSGDPRTGPGSAPPDGLLEAWFTGPPGAAPDQMTMSTFPRGVSPELPASLMDPRTGTMVVVTAPGDVVEVSEHSVLAADGYRSRPYEAADVTDGIATTRLGSGHTTLPWAVSYRVVRADRNVLTSTPDWVETSDGFELPTYDISYPRGAPDEATAQVAQSAAFNVLAPLGLSPGEADVVARWVGPGPEPASGTLAVVTVTVPSGAVVATVQWHMDGPDGLGGYAAECGLQIRAAGVPAAMRVYAAACELFDPNTGQVGGTSLVVTAPASVATVRTYDDGGRFLAEFPLADGVLVGPMPEGTAQVQAVTRAGVLLGRTDLMGHDQLWD